MVGLRNIISIKSMLMHIKKRKDKYDDDAHKEEIVFLHIPLSILFGQTKE